MFGDKLFGLREPNALEVQIRKLKSDIRSLRRTSASLQNTQNSEYPGYPRAPEEGVDFTVSQIFETSMIGEPRPVITVSPTTSSSFSWLRGLVGYEVLVTYPTGHSDLYSYEIKDETLNVGDTKFRLAQPNYTGGVSAIESYSVQVRLVSSIYGPGYWSDPYSLSVSASTSAPGAPSTVTVTAVTNGYEITWDVPFTTSYKYSEVYLSTDSTVTTGDHYVGSTRGTHIVIPWPKTNWGGPGANYAYVGVRHVDSVGNASAFTVSALPTEALTDSNQIANSSIHDWHVVSITTASKFAPQTNDTTTWGIYDDGSTGTVIERGSIYFSPASQTLVLSGVRDTINNKDTNLLLKDTLGSSITMNSTVGLKMESASDINLNVATGHDLWINTLKSQSATVTLAKLTTGGTNGSITFTHGIITAYTAPT